MPCRLLAKYPESQHATLKLLAQQDLGKSPKHSTRNCGLEARDPLNLLHLFLLKTSHLCRERKSAAWALSVLAAARREQGQEIEPCLTPEHQAHDVGSSRLVYCGHRRLLGLPLGSGIFTLKRGLWNGDLRLRTCT